MISSRIEQVRLFGLTSCLVWLAGCLEPNVYPCSEDSQCFLDGQPGMCASPGYCAYPDESCASGFAFGPSADELSERCVVPGSTNGPASTTGSVDTSGGEQTFTGGTTVVGPCGGPCNEPPGPCFRPDGQCDPITQTCEYEPLPAGTQCGQDDPCLSEGQCNGLGTCEAQVTTCNDPPTDCHAPQGVCDPEQGGCVYALADADTPCEDGDPCTVDDACDGSGTCVSGPMCPTDNPCETPSCEATGCVYDPLADGTSCGPRPADRCCAGTCVDIASDGAHCGGCFAACDPGQMCESVELTACSPNPADTTGRCTCMSNAKCPNGQICRTFEPVTWRCAPEGPEDCPGNTFVDVSACPNYCTY